MFKITKPTRTELLGYSFLALVYALGIYFSNTDVQYFEDFYVREDGFIEYGTAAMLLCISILSFTRLVRLWKSTPILWKVGTLGFALIFLFGAGEEVSWGQRIFGWESSEYFAQNNLQQETNLHNMMIGETKINKLVFTQILISILVIYLLILPILYRKVKAVKNLTNSFAVPIVQWTQTIAFIIFTVLLAFMPSHKNPEIHELALGVIFFLIFINPFNNKVFLSHD
ncbi:MAG: hypothetical protein QM478_10815 [Flavobacteriaceae bacterium]